MTKKQTPGDFLRRLKGKPVVVKLHSGIDYRGILLALDGYMNIVLEESEEYNDGRMTFKHGDIFLRGNNVLYISTQNNTVV
ncbi:hypothetical protein SNEBB_010542 [Seison nebaliae]|nr:hypothetical protein SNEBB_010542 [Seison nebaliae]